MNYPLLFTYRYPVFGSGFVAAVEARGRVLASIESEGTWFYGVNPGGVAADGQSLEDAHAAFSKALTSVLFDIASEEPTFESLKAAVESFFWETNNPTLHEWEEAVNDVRAGKLHMEGLPREPAESPSFVHVTLKAQTDFNPHCNILDGQPELLATAA
jgi:hypothetical protein